MEVSDILLMTAFSGNGSGGGGGSSDFSTAEVTIINNTIDESVQIYNLIIIEDGGLTSGTNVGIGETRTRTVVLYQDSPTNGYYEGENTVAVSGAIEYDDGDFYVTGDGTITIS